jgi:hypothetical protein
VNDADLNEADLIRLLGLPDEHCVSCHEDEGIGLPMCYVEYLGHWVEVCCEVATRVRQP